MDEPLIWIIGACLLQWLVTGLILRRVGRLEERDRERQRYWHGDEDPPARSWPRR